MGRTGAFASSAKILEETYLNDVQMVFGVHGSTEAMLGHSMSPEDALNEEYTFSVRTHFFEFIKVEDMEKEQPQTYLLSEVGLILVSVLYYPFEEFIESRLFLCSTTFS